MKVCVRLLGHTKPLYEAEHGSNPVVHVQIPNKTAYIQCSSQTLQVTLDSNAATLGDDKKVQIIELSSGSSLAIVSRKKDGA